MVRLLFDEQLSEQLVELLSDVFPDAAHVRRLGAGGRDDRAVWTAACPSTTLPHSSRLAPL